RRPRRSHRVDLDEPGSKLGFEISAIVEPTNLEEVPLHEPDQVLDGALLLAPARRAQLGSEAVVQRRLAERLVPVDLSAIASDDDCLWVVEHGHQRHATPSIEGTEHAAHERLDGFISHEAYVHPPRVLQARGEEADLFGGPSKVAHLDLSEVVL